MFRFNLPLINLIVNQSIRQLNIINQSRSNSLIYDVMQSRRQFRASLNVFDINLTELTQLSKKKENDKVNLNTKVSKSAIELDYNQVKISNVKKTRLINKDKKKEIKEKKTKTIKKVISTKENSSDEENNSKSKKSKQQDQQKSKIEEILLQKDLSQDEIEFSFKNQIVTVYTDGACSSNGQNEASAGIGVYFGTNHPLNVSRRLTGIQTNNRAEITAAITAIQIAIKHQASEINLHTDSKYLIDSVTRWLKKWKSNGWKTVGNQSVKNVQDLKILDDLCQKIKIRWKYVPGHQGVLGNEEADILAKMAIYKKK